MAPTSSGYAQETPPAEPAPPAPTPENITKSNAAGVDYLVRAYGISKQDAEERLAVQDELSEKTQEIAAQFGDRFGGIYIEQQAPFRVVVLVKGEDGATIPQSLRLPSRLQRYISTQGSQRSQAETTAIVERLATIFRGAGNRTIVSFDPKAQKFVVTAPDSRIVQAITRLIPPDLLKDVTTRTGLLPKDSQAGYVSGDYTYGGWTLYGPTEAPNCTSGYVVRMSDSRFGVTTAAHCSSVNPKLYVNGHYVTLASAAITQNSARYDFKVHPTGNLDVSGYVAYTNNQQIRGTSITNSVAGYSSGGYFGVQDGLYRVAHNIGSVMCKQGQRSGLSCGQIIETNASYTTNDGVARAGMVSLGRSSQRVIGFSGDSGGPVFTPPAADGTVKPAGLVSSATQVNETTPCDTAARSDCLLYYMPIERLKDQQPMQIKTMTGTLNP